MSTVPPAAAPTRNPTACILCSFNCGLEVQVENGHLRKVCGDARHPDEDGVRRTNGPALNLLTHAAQRDPISATPYHKYVRVRLLPGEA